jgi:uncharacterized membrane protein YesL
MREQFEALGEELKSGLTTVADLILLNLLFLLCSIPVITVGAAQVACLSSMNRMLRGERSGISVTGYFRDFAASFKKATLAWVIELACLSILAGDYWFAVVYSQPANTFFLIFAIVLAAVVLLAAVWVYPLIARYENSVGAHIKNSFLMGLAHFPKTLLALMIQLLFLLVPFIIFDLFAYFGWFWLLVGASLPLYLTAKLFGPALQNEPVKEDADQPGKEKL